MAEESEKKDEAAEVVAEPAKPKASEHTKKIAIAILAVAVLIIGALEFSGKTNVLSGTRTLATVNGDKITEAEFDKRLNQILSSPQAQAFNLDDPAFRAQVEEQVLNEIINTKLLLEAAIDAGFTATEEETQAEYDLIVERLGSEEILNTELENGGLTNREFRENVHDQIVIQKYIEGQIDLEAFVVSPEEIAAFYDQISGTEGIPPVEDIRPQIESQLLSEKQQEAIGELITTLRDGASIEYTTN